MLVEKFDYFIQHYNNDELDSPPSVITPLSRDPQAKEAPAVRATVELVERRRAVVRSKRKVAKLSAVAEEAAGAGVLRKSMYQLAWGDDERRRNSRPELISL